MRHVKLIVLFILLVSVCACSQQAKEQGNPVVKVNDFVITDDALRRRLASVTYFRGMGALTLEDRKNLLDQEIKKELLVQEALRQGFDRDDAFRAAIEKYWEQTLITTLLKQRMEEINKNIIVTAEEVDKAYQQLVEKDPNAPKKETIASRLESSIREKKKTEALAAWTDQLRKNATIKVYDENLASLK